MRLSRLYSNLPAIFEPITFNKGLSVVLAEIRLPANRNIDTHNLGKTTVGELIDFCLLRSKSQKFFLYKHFDRFSEFIFYLEIELLDGSFLTVARPVNPGTRISFRRSNVSEHYSTVPIRESWDHVDVAFDRAKTILDGILGLRALGNWEYRKIIGYLIRSQADYQDVFQLRKFAGKHQDWKPFVAHMLGVESELAVDLYETRAELADISSRLKTLMQEWGADDIDSSVLDGLIAVKRRNIIEKKDVLDNLNFSEEDTRINSHVVQELEFRIADLNEKRYYTSSLVQRLSESTDGEAILFRTEDAEELFREAGVVFGEQIKHDFDQLIAFNRAITMERHDELLRQLEDSRSSLAEIENALLELNAARSEALEFLRESESLAKYKDVSRDLTSLESDLKVLEAKREAATRVVELRQGKRSLTENYGHIQTSIEREIEDISGNDLSRFGNIRRYFNEIIHDTLGQDAILAIKLNPNGGLDFIAEFVGESGIATSGDRGTSYKKVLCMAFDLAILRAYLDRPFARFVYHDGALEQLEPRKRQNLISVFRQYANLGLQPIFSVLDSDLPERVGSTLDTVNDSEVILRLHDEGDEGRLFKMPPW